MFKVACVYGLQNCSIMERYSDPNTHLSHYATHFFVHCPKCDGRAFINSESRLTCTACFHVEQPTHWYGAATAYVAVKCRECHHQLSRSAPWNGQWKKLAMHCEKCGDDCEYEASISKHHLHQGRMTDPVFGLPLWMQKEFRNELFWAYNHEHLDVLRNYISAKLRERSVESRGYNPQRKNNAMLSRLPDFMKKASNREDLLKVIDYLATK